MLGLESFIVQGAFKVCLAVTAIIFARMTVLWMDKHIEQGRSHFARWLNNERNGIARGIYYGSRWIGVAIIVAGAVS